jgi:hypothetical protein
MQPAKVSPNVQSFTFNSDLHQAASTTYPISLLHILWRVQRVISTCSKLWPAPPLYRSSLDAQSSYSVTIRPITRNLLLSSLHFLLRDQVST